MGKWRKVLILLMLIVFIAGLGILLYPCVQGAVKDFQMTQEARAFLENVPTSPEGTEPDIPNPEMSEPILYPELLEAMKNYNKKIWEEKQAGLCDPWAYEQPSFSLSNFGLEDEMFGVICIPKLDLELPIYLGATYQHMAGGVAHLSQTSLPIGGENTNCVIAGHRGWGGASYFRYITDLKPGDEVIITNLWETLTYEVVGTEIIQPNDVEKILVKEGRDMLTLLTCHPYASGGRQRYDNCTFAAKKMFVSQFIKSVYVYRNYTLEVEFNVSFEEFRSLAADTVSRGNERADVICQ